MYIFIHIQYISLYIFIYILFIYIYYLYIYIYLYLYIFIYIYWYIYTVYIYIYINVYIYIYLSIFMAGYIKYDKHLSAAGHRVIESWGHGVTGWQAADLWSPPLRSRPCRRCRWLSGPEGSAAAPAATWTPPRWGSPSCPGPASWSASPGAWSHPHRLGGGEEERGRRRERREGGGDMSSDLQHVEGSSLFSVEVLLNVTTWAAYDPRHKHATFCTALPESGSPPLFLTFKN